ncbi:hypothetical protein FSP39_016159 [Pinctada imbricata]|uniref:Carboxylic ester hydrolase n=1 Tax=Pinctada imbricata TaxID=66713 RepID=A0AA88YSQ2_PINIB|nr:hypothetical protein FSP39_016159 [Pinctada imbricata]
MYRRTLTYTCLLHLFILTLADDTLVKTPLGPIRGLELTDEETGKTVYEFRGIRFAKAPTGERRFRKPEPVDPWAEEYDGTEYGYACPQMNFEEVDDGSSNQSEDCLFLNVYVPHSVTKGEKLSVMVWIHGGGLTLGNGFFYDGTRLAVDGNVIVVTINYRLGLLGFLGIHHSAARGNYGLWDQIAALQWVQHNIASFRGDPNSVTIFGESAGAWCVSFLTLIPSNKGLFTRAIAQSGVAARYLSPGKREVQRFIQHVSELTNCSLDNKNDFIDCLRKTDVAVLLQAADQMQFVRENTLFVESLFGPIVDGELFPDNPMKLLEDQSSPQSQFLSSLDFVAGTVSQEGSLLYMSIMPDLQEHYAFDAMVAIPAKFICGAIISPFVDYYYKGDEKIKNAICSFYTSDGSEDDQSNRAADFYGDMLFNPWTRNMLDYHARPGEGKTYQYQVSKLSPYPTGYPYMPPPSWFKGAGHFDEAIGLFRSNNRKAIFNGTISDDYKQYSRTMIAYWTSFAKTGVPCAGKTSLPWLEYDTKRRMFMEFDDEIYLRQNWKSAMNKFWSGEIPPVPIDEDLKITHDEL